MYGKVNLDELFRIHTIYTASCRKLSSTHSFPGESHDFWEIVIVLDGQIGVTAGQNILLLNKGQAILHEPMEFHRLWSEGASSPETVIISFSCSDMPDLKSRFFNICDFNEDDFREIIKELREVFTTSDVSVTGIKNAASIDYQLSVKKLESLILNILPKNISMIQRPVSASAKNYSEIIRILENNLDKNLKISELAKMCNMSEINLKKTFNRYAGTGIKTYFNQLKMNEAISLLKSGLTVTETASALGFSDQNYFSAAFKRITGSPPSAFRTQ